MAPFTDISTDRPSRFTDGTYGVLYLAKRFETALLETMNHHSRFMMRTQEAPGWTSQFRELVMDLDATLHDLRGNNPAVAPALDPDSYVESQALAKALRTVGSDGQRWALLPRSRPQSGTRASPRLPLGRHAR